MKINTLPYNSLINMDSKPLQPFDKQWGKELCSQMIKKEMLDRDSNGRVTSSSQDLFQEVDNVP